RPRCAVVLNAQAKITVGALQTDGGKSRLSVPSNVAQSFYHYLKSLSGETVADMIINPTVNPNRNAGRLGEFSSEAPHRRQQTPPVVTGALQPAHGASQIGNANARHLYEPVNIAAHIGPLTRELSAHPGEAEL